jgi:glycosyltransferase involved in cell wall biosynthesis
MLQLLDKYKPDFIHIATEGSLGLVARMACLHRKYNFTSAFYTDLPQYVEIRLHGFKETTFKYLEWFHSKSKAIMVNTKSSLDLLKKRKFRNLQLVPLGIDVNFFKNNPNAKPLEGLIKPIFVFLGRLAPEKNLEAFLDCNLPGTKLLIGDGPSRKQLEKKYQKNTKFVGYKTGQELVDLLSVCDVFVFPSLTDTFGLVILEAMACGLPVAGYDATGPRDIITNGVDGYFGPDLVQNAINCLSLKKEDCRSKAEQYSVEKWVENFAQHLVPIKS